MEFKVFLLIFCLAIIVRLTHCGHPAWIRQCEYDASGTKRLLVCQNITSEAELEEELMISSRYKVDELIVEFSNLRFFLHDSFIGTEFKKIYIRNCSLLELTDTHLAFEGLEDHLESLVVEHTSFASHWDFHHLKNLRKLREFVIVNSDLVYASNNWAKISNNTVEQLELFGNEISWIHDYAFSDMEELKYLILDKNDIRTVKRSMFPEKNNKIEVLGLSRNFLEKLPIDLFTNMPKLKVLKLSGNLLWTLDERVFGNIWNQLYLFSMSDSPLSCDCRLKWIAKRRLQPKMVFAKCSNPPQHKGKLLLQLKTKDLWC